MAFFLCLVIAGLKEKIGEAMSRDDVKAIVLIGNSLVKQLFLLNSIAFLMLLFFLAC